MIEFRDNPYVGPRTFTRQESNLFFGREREARDLLSTVMSARLVLFYAQSGAGKSSLIHTRLIPQLMEEGFVVLPVGRVGGDLPEGVADVDNLFVFNLLLNLDDSDQDVGRFARVTLADFLDRLTTTDGEYFFYDAPMVQDESDGQDEDSEKETELYEEPPHVLIIDQFEEIITQHPERWQEREDFFRQLDRAMSDDPRLWVVLTLREDHVAALDPYAPLLADKLRVRFYMQRMQAEAALQAIERPAEKYGRTFAPGVAQSLVENLRQIRVHGQAEAETGQFVEPVQLQVVCYQLWENVRDRPEDEITQDDLPRGYIDRALIQFYEDAVRRAVELTNVHEDQLRDWFERQLITEGGTRASLYRGTDTGGLPNETADLLVDLHVLRTETRAGGRWVELVHDRLVDPITQANAAWRQAHPLIQAALEWREAGKPENKLYQGGQLAAAQDDPDAGVELVRAFLHAGRQAQEEREAAIRAEEEQKRREAEIRAEEESKLAAEQARANRRLRWLVVGLAVVFVLAVGAAIAAVTQTQQAKESAKIAVAARGAAEGAQGTAVARAAEAAAQRSEAKRQRQIALVQSLAASAPYTNNDDELTTLLAVQSLKIAGESPGPAGWLIDRALRDVLSKPYFNNTLRGHEGGVSSVAFSSDGRWLASSSDDHTLRVWDMNDLSASPRVLSGHEDGVNSVAFSPDGRRLASGSDDRTVRVWDMNDLSTSPRVLSGHESGVNSVAFSPDGRWLASSSDDHTVRVWDMESVEKDSNDATPRVLSGHIGSVESVAFSPDGERIASGSSDQTVRVWDVRTGQQVSQLLGHTGWVRSVAFSPDGERIVSGGDDQTVLVWDMNDLSASPRVLSGHEDGVNSVAFSPDGRWLVSGSDDRTVWVWDMESVEKDSSDTAPHMLSGHEYGVNSVAFSPDGRWLASGSDDYTVRVWDMESVEKDSNDATPHVLSGHEGFVESVAVSPDGERIVSGSSDQTVRVWDVRTGQQVSRLLGQDTGFVNSVAFSPDGERIVSGGDDWTVRVWDVRTGQEVSQLPGHTGSVWSVAFSPDGERIVSGSEDQTVRVWDAATEQEVRQLLGHTGMVLSVAFSPDGKWIVSGSDDQTVRVWDVGTGQELTQFSGHTGSVRSVAFSPDGKWIASGSDDQTVQVWDAATGQEVSQLLGHTDWVNSVAFSPDGERIVSGSADQTVRVWNMESVEKDANYAASRVLSGHKYEVNSVAFSPDGRWLASGSDDHTVRVWIATLKELAEIGCRKVYRNLTLKEWKRYLPGEPYRATCPNRPVPVVSIAPTPYATVTPTRTPTPPAVSLTPPTHTPVPTWTPVPTTIVQIQFHWPVDNPRITQYFGENPDVYAKFGQAGHEGIDFGVPVGTNVYAAYDGEVFDVRPDNSAYGIHVRVRHLVGGREYHTIYSRLSEVLVSEGQQVEAGELIALSGNTGHSFGPHLHFTLKLIGASTPGYPAGVVDPLPYLEGRPPAESTPLESSDLTIYTTDRVRLRSSPTTASAEVAWLDAGEALTVLGDADAARASIGRSGEWIQVQTETGLRGYVAAWYVSE